jgi:hypothetical protein
MAYLRRSSRYELRFPVHIDCPSKRDRVGVVRNVSETGVLVGTPSRFSRGQRIRLKFRTKANGPHVEIAGTVVRTGFDPSGEWLGRLIAVHFDRAVALRRIHELKSAYAFW